MCSSDLQSAKNSNKLTPKWEGPYRVKRVTRPGAVRLETEDAITEGSLAHKFAGGKGEDNGMDQASFKKVSPCREANNRKAKLPKFEQSVFLNF